MDVSPCVSYQQKDHTGRNRTFKIFTHTTIVLTNGSNSSLDVRISKILNRLEDCCHWCTSALYLYRNMLSSLLQGDEGSTVSVKMLPCSMECGAIG
jgi:hypothetical protein